MIRSGALVIVCAAILSGCTLGLPQVERVSDGNIDLSETTATALPDASELDEGSVIEDILDEAADAEIAPEAQERQGLAGLWPFGRKADDAQSPLPETVADPVVDAIVADVVNEAADVAVEDTDTVEPAVEVAAAAPARQGFFARLTGRRSPAEALPQGALAVPEAQEAIATADIEAALIDDPDKLAPVATPVAATAAVAPRQTGLFARMLGRDTAPAGSGDGDPVLQALPEDAVVADGDEVPEPTEVATRRGGLFSGLARKAPPVAEGQKELPSNAPLKYGALATVCGLKAKDMGKQVSKYPESNTRYTIFDTSPNSTAPRTHYVTGFKDGCARKFTAALAIFGGPGGHEATRYAASHKHLPMTRSDREYENLRAKACGQPVGQTCPDRRFKRFEARTVFISVYERFGTNPRWADMLLHDGVVVAKDFKGD